MTTQTSTDDEFIEEIMFGDGFQLGIVTVLIHTEDEDGDDDDYSYTHCAESGFSLDFRGKNLMKYESMFINQLNLMAHSNNISICLAVSKPLSDVSSLMVGCILGVNEVGEYTVIKRNV